MNDFAVQVASLDGFGLDLQDLGANFSSNASRILSEVSLPSGTTGLLATLTSSFENFQTTLAASHQQDLTSLSSYSTSLSAASRQFQGTDDASAHAISTLAASATNDQAVIAGQGARRSPSRRPRPHSGRPSPLGALTWTSLRRSSRMVVPASNVWCTTRRWAGAVG